MNMNMYLNEISRTSFLPLFENEFFQNLTTLSPFYPENNQTFMFCISTNCDNHPVQIVDFKDLALEEVIPVESRPVIISTTYGAAMEEVNVPSDKTGHKVCFCVFC